MLRWSVWLLSFFFFNDTATTEIYTLSLHDALPISSSVACAAASATLSVARVEEIHVRPDLAVLGDRKSTRLNSSHGYISYAVFCLKKKKNKSTRMFEREMHLAREILSAQTLGIPAH